MTSDLFDSNDEEWLDNMENKKKYDAFSDVHFVGLLKYHPCLLDKSQTPTLKSQKSKAVTEIIKRLKSEHAHEMNEAQVFKKVEHLKGKIKKETEPNQTGNKKIVIRSHEKLLLSMMDYKKIQF